MSRHRIVALLIAPALLSGSRPGAAIELRPCHLPGLPEQVLCGSHRVFEDRSARSGRTLDLQVSVLPARSRRPAPDPLFVLAGGPGQGAREYGALVDRVFGRLRRTRDVVLVDLRGTGDSHPLECPGWDDPLDGLAAAPDSWLPLVRRCARSLDADPRFYTSEPAMDDLDEIRAALRYERVNLWGGSYGTRAALVYARRHGERVRTVVLDGAAPFALRTPLHNARGAQRAFDLLAESCRAAPACAAAYPDLEQKFDRLLRGLEDRPQTVTLRHPVSGAPRTLPVTREVFASAIRGFLYVPHHASLIPWIVKRAAAGDFAPFAALALETAGWSTDTMSLGVTLAVVCSEDVARIDEGDVAPAVASTFLGRAEVDLWLEMCAIWPRGPRPESADQTIPLEVPALILSGANDPATPPEWGDRMADEFPRSLHLVIPGVAHNASGAGCMPDLIADFVDVGDGGGLDASCLQKLRRPSFVDGFAGPRP